MLVGGLLGTDTGRAYTATDASVATVNMCAFATHLHRWPEHFPHKMHQTSQLPMPQGIFHRRRIGLHWVFAHTKAKPRVQMECFALSPPLIMRSSTGLAVD